MKILINLLDKISYLIESRSHSVTILPNKGDLDMIRHLNTFLHHLLEGYLVNGMHVIDATIGKGNDTEFLCEKVGTNGSVIGFDIQRQAIDVTFQRLNGRYSNFYLHCTSHENLLSYCPESSKDLILYNLGYLPSYDKSITTQLSSTRKSMEQALIVVKKSGVVVVTVYCGHDQGKEEAKWIKEYVSTLDAKAFHVMMLNYMNQVEEAPFIVIIEKK